MNGMHTNRHHVGLSFYVKALSKGRYGSSLQGKQGNKLLVWMPAEMRKKRKEKTTQARSGCVH
eukprot:376766-Pelagomonas_calceolata.AAC.1